VVISSHCGTNIRRTFTQQDGQNPTFGDLDVMSDTTHVFLKDVLWEFIYVIH
jgi:hypothetical protein